MVLFNWNDSYCVGVKQLDDDHKKLINYLNEMFDLMSKRKPKEEIKPVLDSLRSYTVTHFKNEEKLFDKYNYPETKAHKEKHKEFVDKLVDFYDSFSSGKLMLNMDVMNFLKDWLKTHINGTDKQYSEFLNKKGEF